MRCCLLQQVVQAMHAKGHLDDQTCKELVKLLKARDALHPAVDADAVNVMSEVGKEGVDSVARLDKRQIEQRIEEDRERHKRLREHIWAVSGENDDEYEKMWDEASEVGEDDYLGAEEDGDQRETAVKYA
jgi:CTD kinase subunit gamma